MSSNVTDKPLTVGEYNCPLAFDFGTIDPTTQPRLPAMPAWITLSIFNSIIAFPTFFINLLAVWTLLEKEALRTVNFNILLAILSTTDLLMGLVVQPLFVSLTVCIIHGCQTLCPLTLVYIVSLFICFGCSFVTLVAISLERYFCIEHPLYYNTYITTKKLILSTMLTWILIAMTLLFLKMFLSDFYMAGKVIPLFITSLAVATIVFSLTKVGLTARRQMRAIHAQQAAVQGENKDKIKEYKRAVILVFIGVASVILFFPAFIMRIIAVIKGPDWNKDLKSISPFIFGTFAQLQSFINPLILSLRLSYIRAGVVKRLTKLGLR